MCLTSESELLTALPVPCVALWSYTLGLVCWSSSETGKGVTGEDGLSLTNGCPNAEIGGDSCEDESKTV